MPSKTEVQETLLSAINDCAAAAEKSPVPSAALICAQAARELATAYDILNVGTLLPIGHVGEVSA